MTEKPKRLTWFKARLSWSDFFVDLTGDETKLLIKTIWDYARDGKEPETVPVNLRPVWRFIQRELIQDQIDRENGRKGGNPNLTRPRYNVTRTVNNETWVEGGLNPGSTGVALEEEEEEESEEEKEISLPPAAAGDSDPFSMTEEKLKALMEKARDVGIPIETDFEINAFRNQCYKLQVIAMQEAIELFQKNNGKWKRNPGQYFNGVCKKIYGE